MSAMTTTVICIPHNNKINNPNFQAVKAVTEKNVNFQKDSATDQKQKEKLHYARGPALLLQSL